VTPRIGEWVSAVAFALCAAGPTANAQIVTDGTVGPGGPLTGPNYAIGANLGSQVGGNLFHSFSQFNVNTGQSATFSGPVDVTNIISRVTGSSFSNIDGLLASTIPGANLYLINPKGVLFGANATLDVQGSFYASTANHLKLADGGRFDATTPASSSLTSAPPSAFGFLGPTPAPINVLGATLQVPDGKTLSLIGGNLTMIGSTLSAPGGRIDLASLAGAGEVSPLPGALQVSGPALGSIALSGARVLAESKPGLAGGEIYIRGGQLQVLSASLVSAAATGAENAGTVDISTTGEVAVLSDSRITTRSFDGQAGDVVINAGSVRIRGSSAGSVVTAAAIGTGDAGNITITTPGAVTLSNLGFILGDTGGSGIGGGIDITAGSLIVEGVSAIRADSLGTGTGSSIMISTSGPVTLRNGGFIFTSTPGSGNAGSISINAASVNVNDSEITADTTGSGRGGDITIVSPGAVALANVGLIHSDTYAGGSAGNISITGSSLSVNQSLITSQVLQSATGAGGSITINLTGAMTVANTGLIMTSTEDNTNGSAGNISITAGSLSLDGFAAAINSATLGSGSSGDISINASGAVVLSNSSAITSSAFAGGNAGGINIQAASLTLNGGLASISSITRAAGRAGDIVISVTGPVSVVDGAIRNSTDGSGNAGIIQITAQSITLDGVALIHSQTLESTGQGGSITISAGSVTAGTGSDINTITTGTGAAGTININAPVLNLSGGTITSSVGSGAGGQGGGIIINSGSLSVSGGGQILSDSEGSGAGGTIGITTGTLSVVDSLIASEAFSGGNAGSITIAASAGIGMSNGRISTSTFGSGAGGNIVIGAGSMGLANAAVISAESFGSGVAGTIAIDAGASLKLTGGSAITTAASSADGGNIQISAVDIVHLVDSRITTSVGTGFGNGGNITIDPVFVILQNSQIIANAFGGNGGNISIVSQFFLQDTASLVQASSQLGISGSVLISAPQVDLSSSLTVLPSAFFDASGLLRESCAARAGRSNSFVPAGRGGLAAQPERAGFSDYASASAAPLAQTPPLWLARSGCAG